MYNSHRQISHSIGNLWNNVVKYRMLPVSNRLDTLCHACIIITLCSEYMYIVCIYINIYVSYNTAYYCEKTSSPESYG